MIEQFAKQVVEDLTKTFDKTQNFRDTSSSQIKAVIESSLKKFNLVTREEFDAQTAVLHRTLATLDVLEQKLHKLEKEEQKLHKLEKDHANNG